MVKGQFWHRSAGHMLILGLLTLLSRLPFRCSVAFNWDSAQYALGVLDFDIVQHRPHPPGYILHVWLGKALTLLADDPIASLVWISVAAGVLAVLATYALGRMWFGPRDAFIAGLLLVFSPLFWFYNELALTYTVEAFFSVAVAYACYRTLSGSTRWAYAGALILGLAGGFRQTTLLFLLPLALYAALRLPWRHRLGTGSLLVATCLGWGVPLLANAGGLSAYLLAFLRLSSIIKPTPLTDVLQSMFYGGHMTVLLVVGLWLGLYSIEKGERPAWERLFVILWIAPGLLVALLRHTGQSGYVLFAIPVVFLYTPKLLRGALERLENTPEASPAHRQEMIARKALLTILVFVVVGGSAFLFGAYPLIQLQEGQWGAISELLDRYPPSETIVLADLSRDNGFRHAGYHMPEYHVYGFDLEEIEGPLIVPTSQVVLGWVFQSYQREDNYSLDPDQHQLNTTLDLPDGTRSLLVTHRHLVPKQRQAADTTFQELPLTYVFQRMIHVAVPPGTHQLVVANGRLEIH